MKIKSIIVALGLIITMISGMKSNYFNTTNEVENLNTVSNQEVVSENLISENEQVSVEQEQTDNNAIQNDEIEEIAQEPVIQEVPKETPKTTNSQNDKTTKKNETVSKPSTQETTPKQEQVNTSVANTPKKEEQLAPQPVVKTLTPDDLEYWCVAGGTHHIAGDGANEHGYYSSWNEANQAFENYTKGWASVQYKIDHCSCGKFYFWAIQ